MTTWCHWTLKTLSPNREGRTQTEITSFLSMLNRFGEEKSALLVETFGRLLRQLSGFRPQEYLLEKLHTSAVSQVLEWGVRLPAPYVKGDRGNPGLSGPWSWPSVIAYTRWQRRVKSTSCLQLCMSTSETVSKSRTYQELWPGVKKAIESRGQNSR